MARREDQIFIYPNLIQEENPLKKIWLTIKISEILYLPLAIANESWQDLLLQQAILESSKLATYLLEIIFGTKISVEQKRLGYQIGELSYTLSHEYPMLSFFIELFTPSLVSLECLEQYFKQFEKLPMKKPEKGRYMEEAHLLKMLQEYSTKEKFEHYLIALRVKVKDGREVKSEVDNVIVGFSSDQVMFSLSEIKTGKQKIKENQAKKYEEIVESLKTRFEHYGYSVKNYVSEDRYLKTWLLEISST